MRTSVLLVATAVTAGLALTGCKATTAGTSDGSVAAPPGAKSGSPKAGGAQAKYSGTCDTDLGSGDGSDYALAGEVHVKNTGGVAINTKTPRRS